jgi:hypothetical protein
VERKEEGMGRKTSNSLTVAQRRKAARTGKTVLDYSLEHPEHSAERVARELGLRGHAVSRDAVQGIWKQHKLLDPDKRLERSLSLSDPTAWISQARAAHILRVAPGVIMNATKKGYFRVLEIEGYILVDHAEMLNQHVEQHPSAKTEKAVLAYSTRHPTHSSARVAQELALNGQILTQSCVRSVWKQHALPGIWHERLKCSRIQRNDPTIWVTKSKAAQLRKNMNYAIVEQLVRKGLIRALKVDGHTLVDRTNMLDYIRHHVKEAVLAYSLEYPTYCSQRLARALQLRGYPVHSPQVDEIWKKYALTRQQDRIKRKLRDSTDWITVWTASRLWNVQRTVIRRFMREGLLRVLEIDGRVFVDRAEVLRYKAGKAMLDNCADAPECASVPERNERANKEEAVLAYSLEYPIHGLHRVVRELALRGQAISQTSVLNVWKKHGLLTWQNRLKRQLHDPTDWVSFGETARIWNMDRRSVKQRVRKGHFRTLELNGRTLIDREDVLKHLGCINREAILAYSLEYPTHNMIRVAQELQLRGYSIGQGGVYEVWKKFSLRTCQDRLRCKLRDLTDWISLEKAAQLRKSGSATVKKLAREGRIRAVEIEGRIFIDREDMLREREAARQPL